MRKARHVMYVMDQANLPTLQSVVREETTVHSRGKHVAGLIFYGRCPINKKTREAPTRLREMEMECSVILLRRRLRMRINIFKIYSGSREDSISER